jgi:nucleoid-associated protein YgaU
LLTSLTIPNSVTTIGDDAFRNAELLASLTIGNSVTTIGEDAFRGASALKAVTFLGPAPAVDDSFSPNEFGPKAIVTSANAGTFILIDGKWEGLIVEIAASDAPASDDGAAAARVAAVAEAARVAAAAEAARQAAAAAAAKQQRELTEILSIIPSLGALALSLGETTKILTLQKCVKKKQVRYVKKGAKCPKGFVRKR